MSLKAFNVAILLGWLLVLVGGCILNPGAGLVGGGVLLIGLTLVLARLGGLYTAPAKTEEDA